MRAENIYAQPFVASIGVQQMGKYTKFDRYNRLRRFSQTYNQIKPRGNVSFCTRTTIARTERNINIKLSEQTTHNAHSKNTEQENTMT